MMCWSWIDSSRKRKALTISCPGPGIASLRRCKAGPGQKIAKTTPCKVEWTPARSTLAALRPRQEKKGPNLISSRSSFTKSIISGRKLLLCRPDVPAIARPEIINLRPFAASALRSRWPLRHLDDMPVAANHDNDRVSFLAAALIGRWGQMQLSAVPLARHQRVVLDDRLLELNHVLLATFDGRREHRLVLHGRVILRDHRGG